MRHHTAVDQMGVCSDKLDRNSVMWQILVVMNLIDYLLFYVLLKNISLIWRRHHCLWRAAKFRPMLGSQGLWEGRDLYRTTPAVTHGLDFPCLIGKTASVSRQLWRAWKCGGPILTRILTGNRDENNDNVIILHEHIVIKYRDWSWQQSMPD
jgi:hypothetical protein